MFGANPFGWPRFGQAYAGVGTVAGAAALTAAGSLAASGTVTRLGVAALAGTGTLSATGDVHGERRRHGNLIYTSARPTAHVVLSVARLTGQGSLAAEGAVALSIEDELVLLLAAQASGARKITLH